MSPPPSKQPLCKYYNPLTAVCDQAFSDECDKHDFDCRLWPVCFKCGSTIRNPKEGVWYSSQSQKIGCSEECATAVDNLEGVE